MSTYLSESRRGMEADLLHALELAVTVEQALTVWRVASALEEFCRQLDREARQKAHELSLTPTRRPYALDHWRTS